MVFGKLNKHTWFENFIVILITIVMSATFLLSGFPSKGGVRPAAAEDTALQVISTKVGIGNIFGGNSIDGAADISVNDISPGDGTGKISIINNRGIWLAIGVDVSTKDGIKSIINEDNLDLERKNLLEPSKLVRQLNTPSSVDVDLGSLAIGDKIFIRVYSGGGKPVTKPFAQTIPSAMNLLKATSTQTGIPIDDFINLLILIGNGNHIYDWLKSQNVEDKYVSGLQNTAKGAKVIKAVYDGYNAFNSGDAIGVVKSLSDIIEADPEFSLMLINKGLVAIGKQPLVLAELLAIKATVGKILQAADILYTLPQMTYDLAFTPIISEVDLEKIASPEPATFESVYSETPTINFLNQKISVTVKARDGISDISNLWLGFDIYSPDGRNLNSGDSTKVENTNTGIADPDTGLIGNLNFSNQGLTLQAGQTRTFEASYSFYQSVTGHQYEARSGYQFKYALWSGKPGDTNSKMITSIKQTPILLYDSKAPAVPQGLSSTSGDNNVLLNWQTNTEGDLVSYLIYRGTSSNTQYMKQIATVDKPGIIYLDSTASNGNTYYYAIRAYDYGNLQSSFSKVVSATPKPQLSVEVTPDKSSYNVGDKATFDITTTREATGDLVDADNFSVTFDGSNVSNSITKISTGKYRYVSGNLTQGSKIFSVTANKSGYNSASQSTQILVANSLSIPTGLIASGGNSKVNLYWNANPEANILGYKIYRSTSAVGPYNYLDSTSQTYYTDTSVSNGTVYYYKISAYDSQGNESILSDHAIGQPIASTSNSGYLENGSVSPLSGTGSSNFTYQVTYKNSNNLPPSSDLKVYIDGSPLSLFEKDSNSYSTGRTYYNYGITLGQGTHKFYFASTDGSVRYPQSGDIIGPTVTSVSGATFDINNFSVTNSQFSPNGDGVKDNTQINFDLLNSKARMKLFVQDSNGNIINDLSSNIQQNGWAVDPNSFNVIYDGTGMTKDGSYSINLKASNFPQYLNAIGSYYGGTGAIYAATYDSKNDRIIAAITSVQYGSKIEFYSKTGTLQGSFTPQTDVAIYGITVDSNGNIYLSDTVGGGFDGAMTLHKYDQNGSLVWKKGPYGTSQNQLIEPSAIVYAPNGYLYIYDNFKIKKFDIDGNFVSATSGGYGSENGQIKGGTLDGVQLAADSQSNIYLSDTDNFRIQKFDSNLNFVSVIKNFESSKRPRSIGIDKDQNIMVFVNDNNLYKYLYRLDKDGNVLDQVMTNTDYWLGASQQVYDGCQMVIDKDNAIYISDINNVKRYSNWIYESSIPIVKDTVSPDVNISKPANNETVGSLVTLEGSVNDANQIESWSLDYGSGESPTTWTNITSGNEKFSSKQIAFWNVKNLTNGVYTIRLKAKDLAGNESSVYTKVNVQNDVTPPEISNLFVSPFTFSPNGDVTKDSTVIAFSLSEDSNVTIGATDLAGKLIKILSDNSLMSAGDNSSVWDGKDKNGNVVLDGMYKVYTQATDSQGNVSIMQTSYVIVDNSVPDTSLDNLSETTPVKGILSLEGTASDLNISSYKIEYANESSPDSWNLLGANFNPIISSKLLDLDTSNLPDGKNSIKLTVTDEAGNSATAISSVEIDNTKPSVSFPSTLKAAGSYVRGSLAILVGSTDSGSGIKKVELYDKMYDKSGNLVSTTKRGTDYSSPYSFTLDTTKLTGGKHVFKPVAYDKADNSNYTTRYYFIDNIKPATYAKYSASAYRYKYAKLYYKVTDAISPSATVTIKIKNSSGTVVKPLSLGSKSTNTLYSYSFYTSLAKGTYKFEIYATDKAGNMQNNVAYNTLTIK